MFEYVEPTAPTSSDTPNRAVLDQCFLRSAVINWRYLTAMDSRYPFLTIGYNPSHGAGNVSTLRIAFDGKVLIYGRISASNDDVKERSEPFRDVDIETLDALLLAIYERAIVLGVTAHDASLASEQARQDVRARLQAEGINAEP